MPANCPLQCYLCAKMFKGDSFFNGASEWFTLAVVRPNNGEQRLLPAVMPRWL